MSSFVCTSPPPRPWNLNYIVLVHTKLLLTRSPGLCRVCVGDATVRWYRQGVRKIPTHLGTTGQWFRALCFVKTLRPRMRDKGSGRPESSLDSCGVRRNPICDRLAQLVLSVSPISAL